LFGNLLTSLQRDFLAGFFRQTPAFFLTGGTALAAFYLFHRHSEDLDLFTLKEQEMQAVPHLIAHVAESIGASHTSLVVTPHFRRYLLQRGDESAVVDFVHEVAPQIVAEKPRFGDFIVDSLEDIAANKICTLLGRGEMKDFLDLYFLHQHGVDIKQAIEWARQKDVGVSPATLAFVLSHVTFHRIPDYVLKPVTVEALTEFFARLQEELVRESFPRR
jgi:predicted nucleotidyltransferase component of viral defense system